MAVSSEVSEGSMSHAGPMSGVAESIILCVHSEAPERDRLARLCAPYRVAMASTGSAGLESLRDCAPRVVLVDFALSDMSGIEFLHQCREVSPSTTRILLADHTDLPEIIKNGGSELATMVVPKRFKPESIRAALDATLASSIFKAGARDRDATAPLSWNDDPLSLIQQTALRLVSFPDAVVRWLPENAPRLELQLVIPIDAGFQLLREELIGGWGPSFKAPGRRLRWRDRKHPVLRALGGVARGQELWIKSFPGHSISAAYAAILPWAGKPRATAILGVIAPVELHAQVASTIREIHDATVAECLAFPLPVPDKAVGIGEKRHWYSREYKWVVSPGYVGPDRRERPTSFLNRYVFFGRRHRTIEPEEKRHGHFIDRLDPTVSRLALAYVVLSAIDAGLTVLFAGKMGVEELNPLLRHLLAQDLAKFILVKNAISLVALFLVSRFQLWRIGKLVLGLNAVAYAALDIYWVWLLALHGKYVR